MGLNLSLTLPVSPSEGTGLPVGAAGEAATVTVATTLGPVMRDEAPPGGGPTPFDTFLSPIGVTVRL